MDLHVTGCRRRYAFEDVVDVDISASISRGIGDAASYLFWSLKLVATELGSYEGLVHFAVWVPFKASL